MKMNKLAKLLATYFGLGLSPKAPGTVGSLGTLPLAAVAAYFYGTAGVLTISLSAFFIGVWATHQLIKNQEEKDPSMVVIDEVAGQSLTFTLVGNYLQGNWNFWYAYLIGFALFRLFDIVKMGPVKWADSKLKNAWGVMLDDMFAGCFAAVVLLVVITKI